MITLPPLPRNNVGSRKLTRKKGQRWTYLHSSRLSCIVIWLFAASVRKTSKSRVNINFHMSAISVKREWTLKEPHNNKNLAVSAVRLGWRRTCIKESTAFSACSVGRVDFCRFMNRKRTKLKNNIFIYIKRSLNIFINYLPFLKNMMIPLTFSLIKDKNYRL